MNDLLRQLISMGPALGAGAAGNGEAMSAFMEGFQRTREQLEQQRRQGQQDQFQIEDRERMRTRQDEADAFTREDRTRQLQGDTEQRALRRLQIPGTLAEMGATADTPSDAQRRIESMMPTLMEAFGQDAMAFGQPAVEEAQQIITGRQKKQMSDFVDAALKTSFVADNPDSDPELTQLPEHIARIVGKPSARLSELQRFAALPVGKPAAKTRVPAAAGSMEEFADPATTPERRAEIEDLRKRYMQSDDRPRGDGGLNPYQDAQFTERLAKTWNDANTSGREMRRQLGLMETGLRRFREGDKNGGSQAVLVTFQKILDPTSVVRESEYARSAAGISMLARMEGYMDRLKAGGAGVPDAELSEMVETARQMLDGMQSHSKTQRSRIEAQARKHQIDPVLIFGVEPPPEPSPTTPSGPRVGDRRKFNGVLGEWNGREWVEVKP